MQHTLPRVSRLVCVTYVTYAPPCGASAERREEIKRLEGEVARLRGELRALGEASQQQQAALQAIIDERNR